MSDSIELVINSELQKNEVNLLSVSNLQLKILSHQGKNLSQDRIKEELINNQDLFQINNKQFITVEKLRQYFLDTIDHPIKGNCSKLVNKLEKIIEDNFPVFNIDREVISNNLENNNFFDNLIEVDNRFGVDKELITEVVIAFENYYQTQKQAVRINDYLFETDYLVKLDCSEDRLIGILEDHPLFYQLTSRRFALKLWIYDEIVKRLFEAEDVVRFRTVEIRLRKILNSKAINKQNLFELFNNSKHFRLLKNGKYLEFVTDKRRLIDDLQELYRQEINKQGCEYLFSRSLLMDDQSESKELIDIKKLLSQPKSIEQINNELDIAFEDEELLYQLLSVKNIYYDDNSLYIAEEVGLEDMLYKMMILIQYLKDLIFDYSLSDLLSLIFKSNRKPIRIEKIREYLTIFYNQNLKLQDIREILDESDNFLQIDYQMWIAKDMPRGNYEKFSRSFSEDFNRILERFDDRDRYILRNRILDFANNSETLKEIGARFEVSRERIRQLEKAIKRKLSHSSYKKNYIRYIRLFEQIFRDNRVLSLDTLVKHPLIKRYFADVNLELLFSLYNQYGSNLEQNKVSIINDDYVLLLEMSYFEHLWQRAKDELGNEDGLVEFDRLVEFFAKFKIKSRDFLEEYINGAVDKFKISSYVMLNDDRIYITDKLKLILGSLGEPTHYKKLAEIYCNYFDYSSDHNVHSKLNSYEDFVRVDSGTYGLASWGCQEDIYVRDLNYRILKEAKQPMHYEEIIQKVLEYKDVGEKTVYHFLIDNKRVFNYSRGVFALKEWQEDEKLSAKYRISSWRIRASEEDRINDYMLGSCLGHQDRLISLHKFSKNYYHEGRLSIPQRIINSDLLEKQVLAVNNQGMVFSLSLGQASKQIYGLQRLISDCEIEVGDLIYFEYYGQGIVKVHSREEYEQNYSPILEEDFEMDEQKEAVNKIMNIIFGDESDGIDSFDSAVEYGLKNGYVEFKQLLELDYDEEEVVDHFEAIQILDDKNIEIIYDD
ncbi:MAG: sigma factor-like helix-turn-helix DNA-binding protein [Bacillota bacterium]